MEINLNRPNHVLRAHPMGNRVSGHYLVFYDVESYVDDEGRNFPYLLCVKYLEVDRNFNILDSLEADYLWEDKNKFINILITLSEDESKKVTAFAHNHHYDLLVNSGVELYEFTDDELQEVMDNSLDKNNRKIYSDSIIDTFTSGEYGLIPFQMSTSKPRFIELAYKDKIMDGAIKHAKNSITFIDSMNYFPQSLAKIGKSLGMDKGDLNHRIDRRGNPRLIEEAKEYCKNDVNIVCEAVLNFLRVTSKEFKVPKSTPSAVFNMYLRDYVPYVDPIYCHDKRKALDIEVKSYSGARTEVYTQDKEVFVHSLDVNSLYPYGMKKYLFPTNVTSYQTSIPRTQQVRLLDTLYQRSKNNPSKGIIAYVKLNVPTSLRVAPFPKRLFGERDKDTRLIFPTGEFFTYLATPEFLLAYELGYLKEVHKYVMYEMSDIFSHFIGQMYGLKLQEQKLGRQYNADLYKLCMNSLGGKFGQIYRRKVFVGINPNSKYDVDEIRGEDNKTVHQQTFGYSIFEKESPKISFDAVPSIASHINSYARVRMWELMQIAGEENIHYIDNDGLKVNDTGYERLKDYIDPDKLGMLKYEYNGYLTAHVAKDYEVRDAKDLNGNPVTINPKGIEGLIVRMKGIDTSSEKLDSLIGKEVYSQERFQTPYDAMMQGSIKDFKPTMVNVKRNLVLHGRVLLENNDTMPIALATDISRYKELNHVIDKNIKVSEERKENIVKPMRGISADFRTKD